MATETLNRFALLAEHHADLQEQGEIHKGAGCRIPKMDGRTLSLLQSHAEVAIADVAAGMQAIAHLLTEYPEGVGMEPVVMPQIGRLLRVLGEALEHTHDAAHMIADRQWAHDRIQAAEGKPC